MTQYKLLKREVSENGITTTSYLSNIKHSDNTDLDVLREDFLKALTPYTAVRKEYSPEFLGIVDAVVRKYSDYVSIGLKIVETENGNKLFYSFTLTEGPKTCRILSKIPILVDALEFERMGKSEDEEVIPSPASIERAERSFKRMPDIRALLAEYTAELSELEKDEK